MEDHEVKRPRIPWAVRWLALILAAMTVGGLIESYNGLFKVATDALMPVAWIWPCLVDGLAIAMSLVIWEAGKDGDRAWGARFLLVGVTGASAVIQAATAPETWAARAAHGWPPVLTLITFEALLLTYARASARMVTGQADMPSHLPVRAVVSAPAARIATAPTEVTAAVERPAPKPRPGRRPPEPTGQRLPPSTEVIRQAVAEIVRDGRPVTSGEVAEKIGRSDRTLRRYHSAEDLAVMAAEVAAEVSA